MVLTEWAAHSLSPEWTSSSVAGSEAEMRCLPALAVVMCCARIAAADSPQGQPAVPQQAAFSFICGSKDTPSGVLRVMLRDEQKGSLPGATVTLLEPNGGVVLAKGTTGSDGSVMFPGMAEKPAYVVGALLGFHAVGGEAYVASGCTGTLVLTLPLNLPNCQTEVSAAEAKASSY